jgi:hypothetical protein
MSRPVGVADLPAALEALQQLKPELETSGEPTS